MKLLITGATHGIGRGVAQAVAALDTSHEVIILCRSEQEGEATCDAIKRTTGNTRTSFVLCDLLYMDQVRRATSKLKQQHPYLDGIFINAGIGYSARHVFAANQIDAHFQVNYLSHFLLTMQLLELVERSTYGGRIIINTMKSGTIHWDDIQLSKKWNFIKALGQSMAAKRLFYQRLHSCLQQRAHTKYDTETPPSVFGYAVHKSVWTNQSNIIPGYMKAIVHVAKMFGAFISEQQNGDIIARLFTEPHALSKERSGKLISWKGQDFIELNDEEFVSDPEVQKRLWDLSLQLTRTKAHT